MKAKKYLKVMFTFFSGLLIAACQESKSSFDASGSFEAEETLISSQVSGILEEYKIEEGQIVRQGEFLALVDTLPLHLKKKQLEAQIEAVLSKKPDKKVQLASLKEQLSAAKVDKERIKNLVEAKAAGRKQLDDINSSIAVLEKQMRALRSSLDITSQGMEKESAPLEIQIEQIQDQINRSIIKAPMDGTILTRYARKHEMAAAGKALFKMADLSSMILRVYVSSDQLSQIKLGQKVKVMTDDGKEGYTESEGKLIWISDVAEFTPKTIQTKNERANQVYGVKVQVKNDGRYKIGMYGEIKL